MNAIDLCDQHVYKHCERGLQEACEEVEKKRSGVGCLCPSCRKAAVSEINSWLNFVQKDDAVMRFEYHDDGKDIFLVQVHQITGKQKFISQSYDDDDYVAL